MEITFKFNTTSGRHKSGGGDFNKKRSSDWGITGVNKWRTIIETSEGEENWTKRYTEVYQCYLKQSRVKAPCRI